MGNACIGWLNLADQAALTASSQILLASIQNVQTTDVLQRWRSTEGNAASFVADFGAAVTFDTVCVAGLTMSAAGTARLRVSSADVTGAAGDVFDSGAIAVDPAYNQFVQALPAPISGRYLRVDLVDIGSAYVEAGRLIACLRQPFAINFAYGWSRGYRSRSLKSQTSGGQTKVQKKIKVRTLNVTFSFLSEAEANGFVEQVDLNNGDDSDVLFIIDPDSATLGRDTVWGLMTQLAAVTQPSFAVFEKQYQLEGRL